MGDDPEEHDLNACVGNSSYFEYIRTLNISIEFTTFLLVYKLPDKTKHDTIMCLIMS